MSKEMMNNDVHNKPWMWYIG